MTIRPWTGKLLRQYRKEDRQVQARLLDRDGRTSPKESKATGKGRELFGVSILTGREVLRARSARGYVRNWDREWDVDPGHGHGCLIRRGSWDVRGRTRAGREEGFSSCGVFSSAH